MLDKHATIKLFPVTVMVGVDGIFVLVSVWTWESSSVTGDVVNENSSMHILGKNLVEPFPDVTLTWSVPPVVIFELARNRLDCKLPLIFL
jgi:hypothetical protein